MKNYSAQGQPYTTDLTCFKDDEDFAVVSCLHDKNPSKAFDDNPIFLAILYNNIESLIVYTEQISGSLKTIAKDGKSVLHYAVLAEQPDNDIIEFCLQKGVNIDKQDDDGNTALHLAVFYNQDETVKLLLANKARSVQNNHGLTPLHLAILKSQPRYKIIKKLTKNKIDLTTDLTTKEKNGLMPLFLAICKNNPFIVKILFTAEPDITLYEYDNLNIFSFIDKRLNMEKDIDIKNRLLAIKDYITTVANQPRSSKLQSIQAK